MTASYTVEVRNPDFESENRIHGDEVARTLGFRGGLVPGVVTYGHMCPAVVVALGAEWLERGEAEVWFTKPVYDGDSLEIVTELGYGGATIRARNAAGDDAATLAATLPAARSMPEDPAGVRLTPLSATLGADDGGPAGLLRLANRFVSAHFQISPWIHAGSRVRHWQQLAPGMPVEVTGALRSLSERRGHKLFELDLLVLARGAPAGQVMQRVIYELAPRPVTA